MPAAPPRPLPATMPLPAVQLPLTRRSVTLLHALVLLSVAAFSAAQQDVTPLVGIIAASVVAWLLVDSSRNHRVVPRSTGIQDGALVAPSRMLKIPAFITGRSIEPARHTHQLPTWILNLIVLAGACGLWWEVTGELDKGNRGIIIALAHFIMVLLACKLQEPKQGRDIAQIVILTLLVLTAGALSSSSGILFCILLICYMAFLAHAGAVLHLQRETATVVLEEKIAAAFPENGAVKSLKHDLLGVSKTCAVAAAMFAVVVFVLMPRTRTPTVFPLNPESFETGYTDTVQFHDEGTLSQSDTVIMHVRITRDGGASGSRYDEPYFRGQVLHDYSAGRQSWYRGNPREGNEVREARIVDHKEDQPSPLWMPEIPPSPDDERQEYTIFVQSTNVLFSASTPVRVSWDLDQISQLNFTPGDMTLTSTGITLRGRGSTRQLHYIVYSRLNAVPPEIDDDPFIKPRLLRAAQPSRAPWFRYFVKPDMLRLPGYGRRPNAQAIPEVLVDPQITDLACDLARDYVGREKYVTRTDQIQPVVRIFEQYLRANYPYSLTFHRVSKDLDPTADFLLNRKATGGHCEYFASAMVMLCRAVGINARLVTGFRGGEYNSIDSKFIVRARDAHTWAEVYIPGPGWTISDPTPGQSGLEATPGIIALWLRDLSQYVQSTWLTVVVTFDETSRQSVVVWVTNALSGLWNRVKEFVFAVKAGVWDDVDGNATRLWMIISILGVALVSAWILREWRKTILESATADSRGPRRAHRLGGDLAFLDDLLRALERFGTTRHEDQTPWEFSRQFIPRLGPAGVDAQWVVETAYAVRFGLTPVDAATKRRINASIARVRAAVKTIAMRPSDP